MWHLSPRRGTHMIDHPKTVICIFAAAMTFALLLPLVDRVGLPF